MTDIQPNQMIALAERLRREVLRKDAQALTRLVRVYQETYRDIEAAVSALTAKIAGKEMTLGQIQRMGQYKDMLRTIEGELQQFGAYMISELRADARGLLVQGGRDAKMLIGAAAGNDARVLAAIKTVNPDVLVTLLGFLDPQGSLMQYWRDADIYKVSAAEIARKIAGGIAQGWNPVKLARELRRDAGFVLESAMRTARTVQLWSYREASRANYLANGDIVTGYQWYTNLDDKTCEACIALSGRIFKNEVSTDAHWNCRCTLLPVTILNPKGHDTPNGKDWFDSLQESRQREILGPAKYEAYKGGSLDFDQLAQHRDDKVFGGMWTPATLKDLGINDE